MSLTSANLTGGGSTTNFQVQYENNPVILPNQAIVIANANALLAGTPPLVENEFNVTTGWFNTPGGKFGTGNRQVLNLNGAATPTNYPGASNTGYPNPINLDAQNIPGDPATVGRVEDVFIAEWSEILMSLTGGKWNAGDSSGEALSQFCSILRFQTGHYNYYGSFVANWLNGGQAWSSNNLQYVPSPNSARSDWVTQTFTGTTTSAGDQIHGDGDQVSFGCALAFLFYLNVQLSFSINQIIAAYSSNMANAYNALTGDPGDPFPFFLNLISSVYPAGQTANIPSPVTDNPFPIAQVSFWDEKNTFGKDEATDIINQHGGLVSEAFRVVVEGFSKQSFNALGVQVSAFTGTFFNLPGVTITPNPKGAQYESGVNDLTPQRIAIPFDITLSDSPGNSFLDQFPMTDSATYGLSVSLNVGGNQVSGSSASTQFELLAGADPYFTNIGDQGNLPYLSQDLRVFTATPGLKPVPIPIAGLPPLTDSVTGAFDYIKSLLNHLNSNSSFTNPNGTDPFTIFPPRRTRVRSSHRSPHTRSPLSYFIRIIISRSQECGCEAHRERRVRRKPCACFSASGPP